MSHDKSSASVCATPGCSQPAAMACPTCIKLGLPVTIFCSQNCFKEYWPEHKKSHRWSGDGEMILLECNAIDDHLSPLGIHSNIELDIATLARLRCCKGAVLSPVERDGILSLTERNVRPFYEKTWGWDRDQKIKELFGPGSYFLLIITQDTNMLLAFSMFKFTWDDEDEPEFPVLFCYELQVEERYRGCGLGARLMDIEKQIANMRNMWKVMLTCFKINERALKFYEKIGFGIDVNSPSSSGVETDYEILSDKPHRKS